MISKTRVSDPAPPALDTGALWERFVMRRARWWLPLALVLAAGVGSMLYVGVGTYRGAPPIPDFVTADGTGVLPFAWFVISRAPRLEPATRPADRSASTAVLAAETGP